MASFLDVLEATDTEEEKPMTNQEYVNDYLARRLGMLKAENRKTDAVDNIQFYLDLMKCSSEYDYHNIPRLCNIQNEMQLKYDDWYNEKNDSAFVDKIVEAVGIDPESNMFDDSGFFYPHEFIKALADIAQSKHGFNKIVCALKVLFKKSEDIMPNPNMGHEWFVRDMKKLNDTLDGIVEYGRKRGILDDTDMDNE